MIIKYPVACNKTVTGIDYSFESRSAAQKLQAKRYSMVTGDTVIVKKETD